MNYVKLAAQQPHRRGLPGDKGQDQRASSELGKLRLKEVITEEQYLAGDEYLGIVGRYRATIEAPRALSGTGRGYDCLCDGEDCECKRRTDAHDGAFNALSGAGTRAHSVVDMTVLYNLEPSPFDLDYLRCGLEALSYLTDSRKSAHAQNRKYRTVSEAPA